MAEENGRQNSSFDIGLISRAEAIKLLPFGRKCFENLVKNGEIGYKKINNRYFYSKADIRKWAEKLDYHTGYTKEAKHGTRISRSSMRTENGYSLERLVSQINGKKLKTS